MLAQIIGYGGPLPTSWEGEYEARNDRMCRAHGFEPGADPASGVRSPSYPTLVRAGSAGIVAAHIAGSCGSNLSARVGVPVRSARTSGGWVPVGDAVRAQRPGKQFHRQ